MHYFTEFVRGILYIMVLMYMAQNFLSLDMKQSPGETLRTRWWLFAGYAICLAAGYCRKGGQILTIFLEYGGILVILLLNFEEEQIPKAAQALFMYLFTLLLNGLSDNLLRSILVFAVSDDFYTGHEVLVQLIDSLIMLFSLICADKLIWKHYSRSIRKFDLRHLLLMSGTMGTDLLIVFADWALMEQLVQGIAHAPALILHVIITFLLYIQVSQLITSGYLKNIYRERIQLSEHYLEEQRKYYLYLENREWETRRFRHDIREHIHMLQFLAEKGEREKLQDYLDRISGKVDRFGSTVHLNSGIAEAIVNKYVTEAEALGITFTIRGYFPSACYITAFDLCTLLSNLLGNALEAVTLCKGKAMCLEVRHKAEEIYIYIENDCAPDMDFTGRHPATTKMDKKSHGFGLENVEEVVRLNGGWIRMEAAKGKFHTHIELINKKPMEAAEKENRGDRNENCDC